MQQIEESYEVRLKRRHNILSELFVGCEIEQVASDQHSEITRIRRAMGGARKTIAYIDTCVHPLNQRDEFHIMYKKVEPLVLEVVEQFGATGVASINHGASVITVIAHYEVDKSDDGYQQLVLKSGRQVALQEQMKRLDEQLKEQSLKRLAALRMGP